MTTTKFTPGPWKAQLGSSDWGLPRTHLILKDGDDGNDPDLWIAQLQCVTPYCIGSSSKERARAAEQQANARLIAAAPLMYEALLLVRLTLGWQYMSEESRAVINAALAAADGENAQ